MTAGWSHATLDPTTPTIPISVWDTEPAPGPLYSWRLKALAVPSPPATPTFALRTGFDSSAWLWEPLSQDSGSARVWHLSGLPPSLCPTGTYPRLDSVSSSLKLSAIVVDRAIKGSFFCTEPRIQERDGELACGSSLPVKHATMAWEQVAKPCGGSPHLPLAHPTLLALGPEAGPFGCPFRQSQDPVS